MATELKTKSLKYTAEDINENLRCPIQHITADERQNWNGKANASDVYDKSEVYSKDETEVAITAKVAEIVAGAPEEFDTLKEMSDWLTEHEDSAAEMNTAIQTNTKAIADNATAIEANTADIEQNKSDILKTEKSTIINQSTIGFQSKNILPNVQPSTAHEGITYTVNADKSITCNGTTGSTASYFSLNSVYTELPDNVDVVFSGCPAGGSANTYALQLYEEASPISKIHWNDYGGGLTGKLPKINNGKYKGTIVIHPNQTVENLTFYPMLRYAGTDDTYEPYIPTVNERIIEAENNILSNTVTIEKIGLKAGSSAAVHLSAVGWYRAFIAERKQTVRSGILMLNRAFNAAAPESYTILFNLTHSNSIFRLLSKNIEGQGITKIRLVYSNTTPQLSPCYIDIYYNSTSGNTMTASVYCESIAATGAGSTFANSRFVVSDFSVAEIPEGYKAVEFDLTGKDVFERLTALETALSQTTE